MGVAVRQRETAPLPDINMTPLIDVMLVLLVMFVITIPLQSHAVKIDLPQGPPPEVQVDPIRNKIVITAGGALLWNGVPVTRQGLAFNLERTLQMPHPPELHLRPEPETGWSIVDEVLAISRRAGVAHMGFVGNEAYARF